MARPIILSNGEMHVGINNFGMVHDFYYPYVGFEDHAAGPGLRHHIGVWVDGSMSWLDSPNEWSFTFRYPHSALIGHIIAKNERLQIVLEFDDFVDAGISAFLRNIHMINLTDQPREVRLFMHQAFAIGDSRSNTDTAQYLPDNDAILHYRGRRAFVISGMYNSQPFDQHTVGLFGIEGKEGTDKDAEDGELEGCNVEHGRVDSTIRFAVHINPNSSQRIYYWIAAGTSIREALYIHEQVQENGILSHMQRTADWWHEWLKPTYAIMNKIPVQYRETFLQSILVLKAHTDKRGAIIASTDTSLLNYNRDAYTYSWPRDAAYVLWPLIRLGYRDEAYRFFEFSKRGLHMSGYLMHKYRADGALGSSWHPYVHEGGIVSPPIQEDETALVLFIFAQYYNFNPDPTLLKDFYKEMIAPMADFMAEFIDTTTGLPRPSYDLWEQTFLTSTYTTAVTYASLLAAADLAAAANDPDNAVRWRSAADDIRVASHKQLYDSERKVFYRGLLAKEGSVTKDNVIDCSSVFGPYIFGLFDLDSEEIRSSIETLKEVFDVTKDNPGLPRHEDDPYRRVSPGITGNRWFITSLWLAQYYIDTGDKESAMDILNWTKDQAMNTGAMGEQLDPVTQKTVAPVPLAWTHAEYVSTILDLIAVKKESR